MSALTEQPFLTKDFSLRGGGIDFLGLRYVNLYMVGNYLIPEINNVTRDMGMFFLGAWIPWKFEEIFRESDFSPKNYQMFRERVEVAISWNMQDDVPATKAFGSTRNRVGVDQNRQLPTTLAFKEAGRTVQNSLYAAAIYGPSLRALGLIESYSVMAKDGAHLKITSASSDEGTMNIVKSLDQSLSNSGGYKKLINHTSERFTEDELGELGMNGLAPSCCRTAGFDGLKPTFQAKLLPGDSNSLGYARTQTARLLLQTLRQYPDLDSTSLRDVWYTGLFEDGSALDLADSDLRRMQQTWSYFMARQYQRYAIELFLWCFEIALNSGCRSIDEAVEYWMNQTLSAGHNPPETFDQVLHLTAGDFAKDSDFETSRTWNHAVHGNHDKIEYVDAPKSDEGFVHGLHMFAGWYWRMLCRSEAGDYAEFMTLGGSDRMGMQWFIDWLSARRSLPLRMFLKDIFSDLIFSQHMRIALSRFDGRAQRLRFILGDKGIEPTISAAGSMGELDLPWMPDRLDTLIDLLRDIDVLELNDKGELQYGKRANTII